MAKYTDEERKELASKLDKELDEFIDKMESNNSKYMDGWNEETWEQEMEEHPFFTKTVAEGSELSPLMQGIQDLKFSPDENTPEELAKNYKEDGNFNFGLKKYRFAIAAYSEGLKQQCPDDVLNVQLLTNRAAAQYHIGNYRSSLIDCRLALKKTPNHVKALVRGAQCSLKLKRYEECRGFCDRGLERKPDDSVFLDMRTEAAKAEREAERNRRRELAMEKKKKSEEAKVLDAIRRRGITVQRQAQGSDLALEDLEPMHPAALRKRVHFSPADPSKLVWPVLFLYPEFGETDFIEAFEEDQSLADHMEAMFGDDVERPPWDTEGKYRTSRIKLYYENADKNKLVEVDPSKTLRAVLADPRYRVIGGTPGFILMADKSNFYNEFVKKYDK